MAFAIKDRVQETTTTIGTGTITLAGAVAGFQSFAAIGDGNTTYYCIAHTTADEWEVGIGTYSSSGSTLTRSTILSSSSAGSVVNFTSGTKNVFCTYPASRSVIEDSVGVVTMPGWATLPAGTTSFAPLTFQSGSNLTTAAVGSVEYDGKVFYATPQSTQRGIISGMQFFRLNSSLAGADVSTAQNVFGVGVTLSSSTVYYFDGVYALSKTAGTTSHTTGIGFGGTATVNNIAYWAQAGSINTTAFVQTTQAASFQYFVQTTSNTVLNGAQAAATTIRQYRVSGSVSVDAGGTFIPQYTLSAAPGGAYTTAAGSYFLIYPIGAAGSNTSVGTWA